MFGVSRPANPHRTTYSAAVCVQKIPEDFDPKALGDQAPFSNGSSDEGTELRSIIKEQDLSPSSSRSSSPSKFHRNAAAAAQETLEDLSSLALADNLNESGASSSDKSAMQLPDEEPLPSCASPQINNLAINEIANPDERQSWNEMWNEIQEEPGITFDDIADIGAVSSLFEQKGIVWQDALGNTLLHFILSGTSCDLADITFLLNKGADVSQKNAEGRTPLQLAIENKCTSEIILAILAKAGPEIYLQDALGNTLLHLACQNERAIEVITALFQRGVDPTLLNNQDKNPLHVISKECDSSITNYLLQKIEKIDRWNDAGDTSLHIALRQGYGLQVIEGCLAEVLVDQKNRSDDTPLHIAVKNGASFEVIQMLLDSGADSNLVNNRGETPLHIIKKESDRRVISLLLNNTKNIDFSINNLGDILHDIADRRDGASVGERKEKNVLDKVDDTLLYLSLLKEWSLEQYWQYRFDDVLRGVVRGSNLQWLNTEVLLETSVNFNEENAAGRASPPPPYTEIKNKQKIISKLLENSKNLSWNNGFGRELLHVALKDKWSLENFKVLLGKLENINEKDSKGRTLLDVAIKEEWDSTYIEVLLKIAKAPTGSLREWRDADDNRLLDIAVRKNWDPASIKELLNALHPQSQVENIDLDLFLASSLHHISAQSKPGIVSVFLGNVKGLSWFHSDVFSLLNKAQKNKWSPLDFKVLLGMFSNINKQNNNGDTLLKVAIEDKWDLKYIDALFEKGFHFPFYSFKTFSILRNLIKDKDSDEAVFELLKNKLLSQSLPGFTWFRRMVILGLCR